MSSTNVTPQELGKILDLTAKVHVPLGEAFVVSPIIAKLLALANQPHPIGALEPAPAGVGGNAKAELNKSLDELKGAILAAAPL